MFKRLVMFVFGRTARVLNRSTWGSCPHPPAAQAQYATPRGRLVACERCGRVDPQS